MYLVRRILLDWPDELCIRILSHLAEALPADDPQARVLIIEPRKIYPPRPSDAIIDLVMLNMGGKLRDAGMLARLVVPRALGSSRFTPRRMTTAMSWSAQRYEDGDMYVIGASRIYSKVRWSQYVPLKTVSNSSVHESISTTSAHLDHCLLLLSAIYNSSHRVPWDTVALSARVSQRKQKYHRCG